MNFYSRPCGRGDARRPLRTGTSATFLLTPLREGRQGADGLLHKDISTFLLTPLREGRQKSALDRSRRGTFLLTPLREGRHAAAKITAGHIVISTHAPAGGATQSSRRCIFMKGIFLLTPLREGRHSCRASSYRVCRNFYSRPCGRGDVCGFLLRRSRPCISTHAPAGGATRFGRCKVVAKIISTHAPAGGATRSSKYCALIG